MPTLQIVLTNDQADRVNAAVGTILALGRPATNTESRQWVIDRVKDVVLRHEKKVAEAAVLTIAPIDIT